MHDFTDILKEVSFKTARSGGAGGQHVNKVETKVLLIWNLSETKFLSERKKSLLLKRLASKLDEAGNIQITCQEKRSQIQNKKIAERKLIALIEANLKPQKRRIATKVPKGVSERRLLVKRIKSEHKNNRKKIKW